MYKLFGARFLWTAVVTCILLTGCYTVIMHPKVADERPDAERLRVECIDCHPDYHVYPYDPYDSYFGSDYYWNNPHFGYYYGYPWWWDDYYWHYYFSPDDPGDYPANPRDVSRPAYGGGVPARTPAAGGGIGGVPALSTESSRLGPPRRETGQTVIPPQDTTTAVTQKPLPEHRTPLSRNVRVPGQAPWPQGSGGKGRKPPKLRQGVEDETVVKKPPETPPAGKTGNTGVETTTPPPAAEPVPEPPAPAEPEPRGRPRRTP